MLNKVIFSVSPIIALLWVACSSDNVAGGTIDPNTVAQNSSTSSEEDVVLSSSSENPVVTPDNSSSSSSKEVASLSSSSNKANVLSSSSNTIVTPTYSSSEQIEGASSSSDIEDKPDLSSSSVGNKGIILSSSSKGVYGPLFPENFSMQCVDADADSPAASMRVDGDSIRVSLMNASFRIPCDKQKREEFIKSVNEHGPIIGIENDTIYVNFTRSKGMVYDCNCAAKATFTLDKIYSEFNYTVFDLKDPIVVQKP